MPLFPPPQVVEHPADLVIDTFGTFLGKRSERMVVRWRAESQRAVVGVDRSDDGNVVPDAPHPGPFPQKRGEGEVSEVGGPKSDAEASAADGREVVLRVAFPQQHKEFGEESAMTAPRAGPLPEKRGEGDCRVEDSGQQHPADRAVEQLKSVWAAEQPVGRIRPSPVARLADQLNAVADDPERVGDGAWRERNVPLSRLRSVTVASRGVTISSDLIEALIERGIGLSFLSRRGQPVAQLSAPGLGGTVQTRRSQLEAYSLPLGVQLAVEFIRGKLRNQKHQLQYSGKYLKATSGERWERLQKKVAALGNLRKQLKEFESFDLERDRDKLMGYEGTGARLYWEGVAIVLEGRVDFPGRQTRGATDPVNSALNYGYGILYGQVSAAIINAGLELYAGFLHVDRPGKPSLVLDLVEEFRAPVVDRAVLAIVNQGILLETDDRGLTAATRRLIADRVLERLATPEPYEGKRWTLGSIIQCQARHLAVAVRGERTYRSYASRW